MIDYIHLENKMAEQTREAWKGQPAAQPARADESDADRLLGWKKPYGDRAPEQHADERTDGRSVRFGVDEIREDAAPGCSCDGGTCTCPDGARFTGNVAKCLSNGSCKHVAADAVDVDALMYERFHSRGEIRADMTLAEFRVEYGHGPREDAADDDQDERTDGIPDAEEAGERLRSDMRDAWKKPGPIGVPARRVTEHAPEREDGTNTDAVPDAAEAQARLQDEARNAWRQ